MFHFTIVGCRIIWTKKIHQHIILSRKGGNWYSLTQGTVPYSFVLSFISLMGRLPKKSRWIELRIAGPDTELIKEKAHYLRWICHSWNCCAKNFQQKYKTLDPPVINHGSFEQLYQSFNHISSTKFTWVKSFSLILWWLSDFMQRVWVKASMCYSNLLSLNDFRWRSTGLMCGNLRKIYNQWRLLAYIKLFSYCQALVQNRLVIGIILLFIMVMGRNAHRSFIILKQTVSNLYTPSF